MLMPPDQVKKIFAEAGAASVEEEDPGVAGGSGGAEAAFAGEKGFHPEDRRQPPPPGLAAAKRELTKYRLGSKGGSVALERLRATLALFTGTHKFHNYTNGRSRKNS